MFFLIKVYSLFLLLPLWLSIPENPIASNQVLVAPQLILEITYICKGQCSGPREAIFYLFDNKRGRYQEIIKQKIYFQKEKQIEEKEWSAIIKSIEDDEFWTAQKDYDSKIHLQESTYYTTIKCKKDGKLKEITLKNHGFSRAKGEPPPKPIVQMLETMDKIIGKMTHGKG